MLCSMTCSHMRDPFIICLMKFNHICNNNNNNTNGSFVLIK
jgi:hypothetical protein